MAVLRLPRRSVLRVAGDKAHDFLQGLVTLDMKNILAGDQLGGAAFLSPKAKVLCDTIVQAKNGGDEIFVDCHNNLAASLLRLLRRHKLQRELEIDDVSDDFNVFWRRTAVDGELATKHTGDGFLVDPRFAGMGSRAILPSGSIDAGEDNGEYHNHRLACLVPEGPEDFKPDDVFPLHGNMDLTKQVSFNKGCYVGQELTTRSMMRGAVRKRYIGVIAGEDEHTEPKCLQGLAHDGLLPGELLEKQPNDTLVVESDVEEEAGVMSRDGDKFTNLGKLTSVAGRVGLCLIRLPDRANKPEQFVSAFEKLPPLYAHGVRLWPWLPPYVPRGSS